ASSLERPQMENAHPTQVGDLEIELTPKAVRAPSTSKSQKPVVLLVHGASASRRTFEQKPPGLIGYLRGAMGTKELTAAEVYRLDWRSSMLTSEGLVTRHEPTKDAELFTLDAAVNDLANALAQVEKATDVPAQDIRIVGHCIGGALVAQAIAQGKCPCKRVVLSALALFFKVGVEGWFKGNDFVLEDELAKSVNPATERDPQQPLKGRIISA